MAGKFADRSKVQWTQIKPGGDRITVHGEKCSAVLNRIVFGFPDYYHKHMNEQISYIVISPWGKRPFTHIRAILS